MTVFKPIRERFRYALLAALLTTIGLPAHRAHADEPTPEQIESAATLTDKYEWSRRVSAAQTIGALGPNLFGDTVSFYTGQTTFSVTDVDLPGNNALPVAITRTFSTAAAEGPTAPGLLGEWELELPHVRGVFPRVHGWRSGAKDPQQRCSVDLTNFSPPNSPGGGGEGAFAATQFWRGNTLSIPGVGDQSLLIRKPDYLLAPTDGRAYPWVTVGRWQVRCLPSLANGEPGEGFEALSPDGTVYRFDWMVRRSYSTIQRTRGTGNGVVFVPLSRDEVRIYATQVRDRFNNTVSYSYIGERLQSITASDGRAISLTYHPSGKISTVNANGRTWRYRYSGSNRLIEVELPDTQKWTMNTAVLVFTYQPPPPTQGPTCSLGELSASSARETMTFTHPSGAVGVFDFDPVRHSRSEIPAGTACRLEKGQIEPGASRQFDTYALARKTITGRQLNTLQWTLEFAPHTTQSSSKQVTLTEPDGTAQVYEFGTRYYQDEGKLLLETTQSKGAALRSASTTYAINPATPAYLPQIGYHQSGEIADAYAAEFIVPELTRTTLQQGISFSRAITSFDAFARATAETHASTLGFSRSLTQSYEDRFSSWIIGLPRVRQINGIAESETTYNSSALPQDEFTFGQRRASYTYNPDSTLQTIRDGRDNVTTLSGWKRGLPQRIDFADLSFKTAVIDNNGWVTEITDEEGNTQGYGYDDLGRINGITYPAGWAATSRDFAPISADEYGIPAGTWKQTIQTGNYRKHIWFDALWRPILEREWDNTDPAATQRFVKRGYDQRQNESFKSFAAASIANINDLNAGTTRTFDALNRPTTESTPSELGTLTTNYSYQTNLETVITNPRGFQQRMKFQAYDSPSTDLPVEVRSGLNGPLPEQSTTTISRDVWGKVLTMTRSGNAVSATRSYLYDTEQRLCQLTEPESGALVMKYDLAGNLDWSAEGRAPAADCASARASVPSIAKIQRVYGSRNWLDSIDYPEVAGLPSPDASNTYFADGQLKTLASGASTWTYTYNSLRKIDTETLSFQSRSFLIDWSYDTQGALNGLSYPNNESTSFNPNALGQASQVGSLLNNTTWHPNGVSAGWTFGNGIQRSLTQTTRKLPDRLTDSGGAVVFDEDLNYDQNGNVETITDARDASFSRTLSYDAQDRLTAAQGVWGQGAMSYDGADNLKTQTIGTKSYTYNYTNQKLQTITDPNQTLISFGYDAKGNQTQKNGQALIWDQASRIARAEGRARYSYDGHGRRLLVEKLTPSNALAGNSTLQIYSKEGQLLYEEQIGASLGGPDVIFANGFERSGTTVTTYHYLDKTLVARKETRNNQTAPIYLHTDILGSVVAETNSAQQVLRRNHYQPFGLPNGGVSGPGFTGHVMDADTSLIYMQARYYDPDVGRFLSMDPKPPVAIDGTDFNRYAYARNNPYRNVDPDGRIVETVWDVANIGIGVVSFGKNVATGNYIGAAIDAVGVVVDTAAAVVPGVPGGAGVAIKAARAADKIADSAKAAVKRGPKTDPSAPHNAKIKEIAAGLEEQGNKILAGGGSKERAIATEGGVKQSRRPDILYETPNGQVKAVNVGRTKSDGTPVTREIQAKQDLENKAGIPTDFVPYDR